MNYTKRLFSILTIALIVTGVCALAVNASAQKALVSARVEPVQRPLFGDYKGVRIGMTFNEVRTKLGKPTMSGDNLDYYVVSQTETVQIAYDAAHRAKVISVDFMKGIGAPDFKAVVGADVRLDPDGSMHKLIFYQSLGFWVSYNRSVGGSTVTITIQKIQ